ncbi:hypothetical protein Tco_1367222 [Tanacetum coccineum]
MDSPSSRSKLTKFPKTDCQLYILYCQAIHPVVACSMLSTFTICCVAQASTWNDFQLQIPVKSKKMLPFQTESVSWTTFSSVNKLGSVQLVAVGDHLVCIFSPPHLWFCVNVPRKPCSPSEYLPGQALCLILSEPAAIILLWQFDYLWRMC